MLIIITLRQNHTKIQPIGYGALCPCNKVHRKFWELLWRCQYYIRYLAFPKINRFTCYGGDDDKIDFKNQFQIREDIRIKHNINNNDFLIVTGED